MKQELRIRFRALRDAIPLPAREAAARSIWERVRTLPEYAKARVVLFYGSFGSEVPTDGMMRGALEEGKRVVLPRIDGRQLRLHEWDPGSPLEATRQGVRQPSAQAAQVASETVDLVLVPGLAFDRRGSRLGYGGGYYDRLLKTAPRAYRVGIAYESQVVGGLPSTHLDVPMDCLVTEQAVHPLPHRHH